MQLGGPEVRMVAMSSSHEVTQLLRHWSNGNKEALEQLTPLVYRELRKLAASHLRRERPGHTLQPTALVHEAYLRLIDQSRPDWGNRSHFFGVAAHIMRQILVDHARRRGAAKRGGKRVSFQEAFGQQRESGADVLALDQALASLELMDARKSKVIELRFFGGLTVEEISEMLDVSVATVGRDLRLAQVWLRREMEKE
jgi:RNA polymerase sigma-70 factor, ECF subfamily